MESAQSDSPHGAWPACIASCWAFLFPSIHRPWTIVPQMWRMTALDASTLYYPIYIYISWSLVKGTAEWSNYLVVVGPTESSATGIVQKSFIFFWTLSCDAMWKLFVRTVGNLRCKIKSSPKWTCNSSNCQCAPLPTNIGEKGNFSRSLVMFRPTISILPHPLSHSRNFSV